MKKGKKNTPTTPSDRKSTLHPQVFVLREGPVSIGQAFARAHFRVKRGQLFLCWKDGRKVKNHYLSPRAKKNWP